MNDDKANLWEAYLTTEYRADTPLGRISIRIGESVPLLNVLLDEHDAQDWALITAHNPGSNRLDAAENDLRLEELRADVNQRGLRHFPGLGIGADPSWPPEESLLILGISAVEAISMGREYGQNAVVCGSLGQPAVLVDCRPENGQ